MGASGNEYDEIEDFNTIHCKMSDFFDFLQGQLELLTGLVDINEAGLTLEDIRIPLFVAGTPGIGKTAGIISTIHQVNSELERKGLSSHKLGFQKIQLGQKVVGALDGIPVVLNGEVKTMQVEELPQADRDGEYGVLFLDELTTVDEQQMQPALGLADDSRSINTYHLPEHWVVVAAGNGIECTNFVRADDAMISRFMMFEVDYNYQTDWRPWAHENNISPDIIAFLNFKPELMNSVESNDMDKGGKMFANPRTWTHLNSALMGRIAYLKAHGRSISPEEIGNIASRFVGKNVARQFAAFLKFKKTLKYEPEKIFKGTEADPELMQKQEWHLLLEACISYVKKLFKEKMSPDKPNEVPEEVDAQVINFLKWMFKMDEFDTENVINGIYELKHNVKEFRLISSRPNFLQKCPEFKTFIRNHIDLLRDNIDYLDKNL